MMSLINEAKVSPVQDLSGNALGTKYETMSDEEEVQRPLQLLVKTPRGRTAIVSTFDNDSLEKALSSSYDNFVLTLVQAAFLRDLEEEEKEEEKLKEIVSNKHGSLSTLSLSTTGKTNSKRKRDTDDSSDRRLTKKRRVKLLSKMLNPRDVVITHQGKVLEGLCSGCRSSTGSRMKKGSTGKLCLCNCFSCLCSNNSSKNGGTACRNIYLSLRIRGRGGIDRQNRVGSKFGGGGVSSAQNAERERKERLKKLALESIDLAKDPYLMRNHLGTYECKLCLTLHTNEANYLAHTQGKKHQQGLARRAHMEKLRQEHQLQQQGGVLAGKKQQQQQTLQQMKPRKVRIGRPAYQVFKSRDTETNQRCLSFELQYPEIEEDVQPQFRFMSAFEQRVESPPDRRFQYLLFAAEPYETIAFKIPNEPIDKGEDRFVTHWDSEDKKFTLTLYFLEGNDENENQNEKDGANVNSEGSDENKIDQQ